MCSLMLIFCCLTPVAEPESGRNLVLKELVEAGIAMPEGGVVKLPPPSLADGLDAKQQRMRWPNCRASAIRSRT